MDVYAISLRDAAPPTSQYPDVKVQSGSGALLCSSSEPGKLLTPTSDYESDATLKWNGTSQTSTISSVKVPRFDVKDSAPRSILRRGEEDDAAAEPSRPNGDAASEVGLSPRILHLKAKAPTVAINDESGEIEKQTLCEDTTSVCRSYKSLTSSRAPDRKQSSAGFPGVVISTDPFWQMRMRNIEPPKHPRMKKAGHYCRKIMTFVCSHVGVFVIVAGYTALGGFIFPMLENDRALAIRQELHEQTHNLSEQLLSEVWKIGLELVTADQYILEDSMISICNFVMQYHGKEEAELLYEQQLAYQRVLAEESAKRRLEDEDRQHEAETECAGRRRRSVDGPNAGSTTSKPINRVSEQFELFAIIWRARNQHRVQDRIDSLVNEFRQQVYRQTVNGWDGRDTVSRETQWTFIGALLYTITVVTTIGYGHMVPRTFEGRVVTIVYSLVGIPLTLLCVANMGSLFASSFRLSYLYVSELTMGENSLFNKWKAQRERKREEEETTGGYTKHNWLRRLKAQLTSSSFGQALVGIRARQILRNAINDPKTEEQRSILTLIRKEGQRTRRKQKIRVPVSVTLIAISCYLLLGALLFSSTESWEFFSAFYFCYITLSTIGFGDFVPGTNNNEEGTQAKLALCSLYLICGLGMMSMTIQLMQDEVRLKVKRIAQHIGLVKARRAREPT